MTYASGLFYAPPTILHVSRGVSAEVPVRLNCPPEITLLRLHAGGLTQARSASEGDQP